MYSTKSATSIMYAGCAVGSLLPPYVVCNATNMYDTWTLGDPPGARYNRSKSGWFDLRCFENWFMSVALPYLKTLRGKKGVNRGQFEFASFCRNYTKMRAKSNFCFLPSRSTHLLQPLSVAFFRPLEIAWCNILKRWKKRSTPQNKRAFQKILFRNC